MFPLGGSQYRLRSRFPPPENPLLDLWAFKPLLNSIQTYKRFIAAREVPGRWFTARNRQLDHE